MEKFFYFWVFWGLNDTVYAFTVDYKVYGCRSASHIPWVAFGHCLKAGALFEELGAAFLPINSKV